MCRNMLGKIGVINKNDLNREYYLSNYKYLILIKLCTCILIRSLLIKEFFRIENFLPANRSYYWG